MKSKSLPFNWKNPRGYLIAIIWQYVSIFVLLRFLACLGTLVVACFIMSISVTKDWKGDLRTMKKMAKTKQSEADIFKHLTEFIRSHSNIK